MASPPDPHRATPGGQPRARALGIPFGGRPGRWNAITDVPGVEVGYVTLIEGEAVRTGVTAIHPRGPAGTGDPVAAGFHAQNGNGEMTGVSWINESGTFNGPVAITNTHAVGVAHAGIIAWTVRHHPDVAEVWLLPVAAETANPGVFRPGEDQALSRLSFVPWGSLDPFYEAVVQATEEAVVNALVANEDMTGRDGHRTPALPRDRVAGLLSAAGRLG